MLDRSNARAERLDWLAAGELREAWLDLVGDSLEPNPFLEPGFALTLVQHTAPPLRPDFIFVRDAGTPARLLALFVVGADGGALWRHPMVPQSTPLIRRGHVDEAFDALFEMLRETPPHPGALLCPGLDADGEVFAALLDHVARRGLAAQRFDMGVRAALRGKPVLNGKRRKEAARLARRLAERGAVSFETASAPQEVRDATEVFLALEGRGWKGARGTALVCDPAHATFARVATRALAREGKCQIFTLNLDGAAIAGGVVFRSRDQAAFWKIAYDETYAGLSPGAQMAMAVGDALMSDGVTLADSCALPNHPMIDHLWTDRRTVADVLVGLGSAGFQRSVRRETARRELRRVVKSFYLSLIGRRPV